MQKIKWKKIFLFSFLIGLFLVFWSNFSVYYESKDFISKDATKLPSVKTGLDVHGFDATDVRKTRGVKTKLGEYFACVKAYFEVKLNVEPTFLGEQIKIP